MLYRRFNFLKSHWKGAFFNMVRIYTTNRSIHGANLGIMVFGRGSCIASVSLPAAIPEHRTTEIPK